MVNVAGALDDPTLRAMGEAIQKREKLEPRRLYLGMSSIGRPCAREQWYSFHWVKDIEFSADTLKLFDDGHRTEDLYAARLQMVPGVTLVTKDPKTGKQFEYSDFGGHFAGHMDGDILGIYQAPKTDHVWEHKATNEKKFNKLKTLAQTLGEKMALRQWDATYYAQGVIYMDYGGYSRHYLTCSTPGGRDDTSVRTNADPVEAARLRARAERIIFTSEPSDRIGDETFYQCRWCDYSGICHEGEPAERNCRTCMHSTPRREGGWLCEFHNAQLSAETQAAGCGDHRYNPHLIPGEVIDGSADKNWVLYQFTNGQTWKDGE